MNVVTKVDDRATYPVHRQDGVALWRQIAGQIQADIASGTCKPGTRLPTEAELSVRFGVNRHTVRRALEELSRDGLVRVEQGRGPSSLRTSWTTTSRPARVFQNGSASTTRSRPASSASYARSRLTAGLQTASASAAAAASSCWNVLASPTIAR